MSRATSMEATGILSDRKEPPENVARKEFAASSVQERIQCSEDESPCTGSVRTGGTARPCRSTASESLASVAKGMKKSPSLENLAADEEFVSSLLAPWGY
mmetsp:Transcript_16218/g.33337  ORF Transcript_16218/g.33337 Transcript_16218/m.33337 type:complete len:100 (+) Transcript_16218:95-394(+)